MMEMVCENGIWNENENMEDFYALKNSLKFFLLSLKIKLLFPKNNFFPIIYL